MSATPTTSLNDLLSKVTVGEEKIISLAGTDADRKVTVSIRRLHGEAPRPPAKAESAPRQHVFHSAESLAGYLAKYSGPDTVVFADTAGEVIAAILDEKAAHGFEKIEMRPQIHPLWKPWSDIAGRPVPLEAFAQFVAQHRRSIVAPEGRELSMLLSQVRGVEKTTIDRGRGKKAINGVKVETLIQGVRGEDTVELPEEIMLHVPLYVGTARRDVELDLCVEMQGGEVVVIVTAGTVAEARVQAFEEMCGVLTKALAEKQIPITLGKPAHGAWTYLPEMPAAPLSLPSAR